MKRLAKLLAAMGIVALIATGCQEDAANMTGVAENDQGAVESLALSEDEDLLYDALVDDRSEDFMYDGYSSFGNGFGKITAPIDTVLRFGRRFDPHPRRVVRDFRRVAEDTALVSVSRVFAGAFVIFEKGPDTGGTRPVIVHRKRMHHSVERKAIYVKKQTDLQARPRWMLEGVSLGYGESQPETTLDIVEVTLTSNLGLDMTLTNPLESFYYSRADIPKVVPGEEVTITVKLFNNTLNPVDPLGNGATETVLLHYGVNRHHHARARFEYAGKDPLTDAQVYRSTWTVSQRPGHVYHAAFDAIDNGTIFDDDAATYPYNSTVWSTPYIVADSK